MTDIANRRKRFLDRSLKQQQRKDRKLTTGISDLYGSSKWKKARYEFLQTIPICENCNAEKSTVVDHKIAHKGNLELFWDVTNWQALCRRCHNRKTALQDSTFAGKSSIFKPESFCSDDGIPLDKNHPWNH